MDGLIFLAVRCFSCQVFHVNQRTKSGKWKCSMCAKSQSIVKVWGRGGRAKDVRRLVMELNAAVGRGEDPNVTVGRFLSERDASGGSNLTGYSDRSCVGWGQSEGFVSARFAQSEEVTTKNSWDESRSWERIHSNSRGGRSSDGGKIEREPGSDRSAMSTTTGSDHMIDQQVIASSSTSSGRSRWGVFATSRDNTLLERSSTATQQAVTEDKSLRTDGRQGRGRKRSLQAVRKDPDDHSMIALRWSVGKQRGSYFLEDTIGGEDREIRPSSRQRRGHNEASFIPDTVRSSTDPWATATAGGPVERGQPKAWGSLDTIGNREISYRRHDSDQHPKPAAWRQSDSRTNNAGSMGVDPATSRWSKFIG